jgi:hypothetical protein
MQSVIAGALWVIAVMLTACALFLFELMVQNRRATRALAIQLDGVSDTHMQGFEALAISLKKLEERVDLAERQIATATWAQFLTMPVDPSDHGPP